MLGLLLVPTVGLVGDIVTDRTFKSTLQSGAPLEVASASVVANLNADLLDGLDAGAFALDADLRELEAAVLALGTAKVPRTGQSAVFAPADDGDLQLGVTWPNPRFTDNGDGTVTDNLTGLIWLADANCFGGQNWADAMAKANALFDGCPDCGGTNSDCGLSDGSLPGEWRLPNVRELHSLISYGVHSPAMPNTVGTGQWSEGDPFSGVLSTFYWSSTTIASNFGGAWGLGMDDGDVDGVGKTGGGRVWPVRGGR
jgi:hypothetical protein